MSDKKIEVPQKSFNFNNFYISHVFNSIPNDSRTCDIHYKNNIKIFGELSSILSLNCLQFCR